MHESMITARCFCCTVSTLKVMWGVRRTSANVIETAWIFVMLCNLRIIHSDDAGIPMEAPNIIRVAVHGFNQEWSRGRKWVALTNIAPHRCPIQRVVRPYHRINELVEASKRGPEHVETGSGIPGLEVKWKGYQHEDETQE